MGTRTETGTETETVMGCIGTARMGCWRKTSILGRRAAMEDVSVGDAMLKRRCREKLSLCVCV